MQIQDGQRNFYNTQISNEGLSFEQQIHLKASQLGNLTSNNNNSKNELKRSSPTLQVFPTGTTLTSVDGLPILKRKRGRPPKNRSTEVR